MIANPTERIALSEEFVEPQIVGETCCLLCPRLGIIVDIYIHNDVWWFSRSTHTRSAHTPAQVHSDIFPFLSSEASIG